jgi:hypothetical protein
LDDNGKYKTQWNNLHRPCGLFMPPGKRPMCYMGKLGAVQPVNRNVPNLFRCSSSEKKLICSPVMEP